MAKKNSPANNDAASLAFSAVENALKDSFLEPETNNSRKKKSSSQKSSSNFQNSSVQNSSVNAPNSISAADAMAKSRAAERIAAKTGSVANDDRFSPSRVLYGLNAKPSKAPLWIASILSIVWIAITGFAALDGISTQLSQGANNLSILGSLDFASTVATVFLPVLGFFAIAILARRAQDLRIAAASMTQAAVRLAEPETTAADKVATVGQAVRREVTALADGLERAISRAGELEVMIHNEVTVLDKTYSENESRMRGLIQELASQRDSVITNSERVREAISESHSGLVFDLDMIAQRIAGTIEERGGELTSSMNNASDELQRAFGEKSESFISLVDNRTTDLMSALDDSAGRLNLTLEDRTANISSAFEERTHELASVIDMRMSGITEALDTRAVALNEAIDERTASISSVLRDGGAKILTDLRDRGHEVGGALDAIGMRISNEISGRAVEAEATLTHLTGQMDEMISTQINSMESRMQSTILEISGAVDETSDMATKALLGAGEQSLDKLDTRMQEVAVVIDTRLKSFDEVIGEKGERLTSALDGYTTSFASRANVLELALDEKTGHFNDQISMRTRELAETIGGRANQITQTIDAKSATLNENLQDLREQLEATLDGTTEEVSSVIAQRTEELAKTIVQHGMEARDKIDTSLINVTQTMDTRSNDLTVMISDKVTQVNESLGRGIENAVARISDAESGINARVEAAAATVNQSANLTADLIEAGVNSARKAITDMVDERLSTLPEAITSRAEITADRLAALNETISHTMDKTSLTLEDGAERIENTIGRTMDKTIVTMEGGAERLETTISNTMTKTVANLEDSAERIENTINSRIIDASRNMANDVAENANRMDYSVRSALEKISEVAARFDSLVRIDATQTAMVLGQQVETISNNIEEKTGRFAAIIEQKSSELSNSLSNHTNILGEALQANATQAQNIMSATSSRMMSEVTASLEKLNESNALLQNVLDASTGSLAKLEQGISSQTSLYSNAVREALGSTEQAGQLVGEHVGAMQTTIRSMMEEFSSMVGKLDGKTANIDRAAQNLSQTSTISLDAVEARREAMDALAAGFTARADDIDTRLRNFAQSIATTVNETENRLVSARKSMDEALSATTDAVTERLQSLSETANSQGTHTSSALQATQEAMLAEMQTALADATKRFNDTAQSMQDTARQVGSELESTRSELQSGFLELPEETKASAAAMRSVVAEQIEALTELNSIVRAQPASHDFSRASSAANTSGSSSPTPEPLATAMAAPAVAAPAVAAPAAVAPPAPPARHQAPLAPKSPAPVTYAPSPATRQAPLATVTPQANPAQANPAQVNPAAFVAPSQLAPAAPATTTDPLAPFAASSTSASSTSANGWLRDVLRNASANQQANNSATADSLNSLSFEMARAIDEFALTDAWQRYQNGETGVFSRRIYTLTGQGTYDDVRKKLQRDQEFAKTAREYVAEFEQLLQTATNPADARKILISDRGKVFTMLAHASGRIG